LRAMFPPNHLSRSWLLNTKRTLTGTLSMTNVLSVVIN
jgi:hypothetical protein